jgi:hypothetical protein
LGSIFSRTFYDSFSFPRDFSPANAHSVSIPPLMDVETGCKGVTIASLLLLAQILLDWRRTLVDHLLSSRKLRGALLAFTALASLACSAVVVAAQDSSHECCEPSKHRILPTSTAVRSNVNPAVYGQPITFTAAISWADLPPTGTVTFRNGSSVLATVGVSNATATFATAALPEGADSITATYNGDNYHYASTSGALVEVVNQ